jgi:aldose 1-epimerase
LFRVNHITNSENNHEDLEIFSSDKSSYAKIFLNQGASLQELTLNGQELIKDMSPMTYENTYASSILFPFANRIQDGSYEFEGKSYQLDINQKEENNTLHGLVYNKTFEVVDEKTTETFTSVKLVYHEKNISPGFPFTYSIYLEYVLTETTLTLNVEIKNTESKTFPFTLGWHPYFLSSDLYNSSVIFDSKLKLKLDHRNITEKMVHNDYAEGFKISNQSLDDCFILDSNEVLFMTPSYILELKSSEKDSFLQLYTPPHKNTIAIEQTTGVSNSFNNGIGLKKLKPNETYTTSWDLKIK